MSDKVFILCKGERGEGQFPISAHGSFIQAVRASSFKRNDFQLDADATTKTVRAWKAVYANGTDEEWIYHLKLQTAQLHPVASPERTKVG